MKHDSIPVNRKALKINLDTNMYGSFAEKRDRNWEKFVPMVVAKAIKEKGLFGYSDTKQG